MKINTVPVEAYRQAGELSANRKNIGKEGDVNLDRASEKRSITLPGSNRTEAATIRAQKSPSLLNGVLSPDEKDTLIRYFARFGDSEESSQIYGTNARTRNHTPIGQKVDLKG